MSVILTEFWAEDTGVYVRLYEQGRLVFYDTTEGDWPGTAIFAVQIAQFRLERLAKAILQEAPDD